MDGGWFAATWFLVILFNVGAEVVPMENLQACELARDWIRQNHLKDLGDERSRLQADRKLLCVPYNEGAIDQLTPEVKERWQKRLKRTPSK